MNDSVTVQWTCGVLHECQDVYDLIKVIVFEQTTYDVNTWADPYKGRGWGGGSAPSPFVSVILEYVHILETSPTSQCGGCRIFF